MVESAFYFQWSEEKNLKCAAQYKGRGLPTQAFSHRSIPDKRNMRARYLKHGDTGGTRATFLHGCLKFDIKELRADSPLSMLASLGRSHICEVTGNSWVNSHACNKGSDHSEWQLFFTSIIDPNFKKKQMQSLTLPRAVSLRISPLLFLPQGSRPSLQDSTLKGCLVVYCSDRPDFYYHAWLVFKPGERTSQACPGLVR